MCVCVCVCVCVCLCVCDLYQCILVAINELCKALGAPERQGAVQKHSLLSLFLLMMTSIPSDKDQASPSVKLDVLAGVNDSVVGESQPWVADDRWQTQVLRQTMQWHCYAGW